MTGAKGCFKTPIQISNKLSVDDIVRFLNQINLEAEVRAVGKLE